MVCKQAELSVAEPEQQIDWRLQVDADAPAERLEEIERIADEHCPGVYCVQNAIDLRTHLSSNGDD